MQKFYDISRSVDKSMMLWPGRKPPQCEWEKKISEGDALNLSSWRINSHCGTHIDAPYHFFEDGLTVDKIDPGILIGECMVVDLVAIGVDILDLAQLKKMKLAARILFRSTHSSPYPSKRYQKHPALLTAEAAAYLIEMKTVLIGTDRLSVDPSEGLDRTIHKQLLEAGCIIVEGLCLAEIEVGNYQLYLLPLKLEGAEASPARAFLATL